MRSLRPIPFVASLLLSAAVLSGCSLPEDAANVAGGRNPAANAVHGQAMTGQYQ